MRRRVFALVYAVRARKREVAGKQVEALEEERALETEKGRIGIEKGNDRWIEGQDRERERRSKGLVIQSWHNLHLIFNGYRCTFH